MIANSFYSNRYEFSPWYQEIILGLQTPEVGCTTICGLIISQAAGPAAG